MKEPRWLDRAIIEAIHREQIREHGGLPGIHNENSLEAALARPLHKWSYNKPVSIHDCAAAYAFAVAKNHPFADGNKRTAFIAAAVFLQINGWQFDAAEAEVVRLVLALAAGGISERRFAEWLKANSGKVQTKP